MTYGSEELARVLAKQEGLWEKLTQAYFVVSATIQQKFDEGLACSTKLKEPGTFDMTKVMGLRYVRMAHGGTVTRMEPESGRARAEFVRAGATVRAV
jgi:hypothetical protein